MKILIVNQHSNNFGDDAAGTALVNMLLKRDVDQVELMYCLPGTIPVDSPKVIHNHQDNVRDINKIEGAIYLATGIKLSKFMKTLSEKMYQYDYIIVSPCGSNLGIYKDWRLLIQDLIITKSRPLIFHLNTIAASGNVIFDRLVRKVCRASNVYVRERASQRYLESFGIDAKWGPDSAFMLESKGDISIDDRKIVFVPSDVWSWHVKYMGKDGSCVIREIAAAIARFANDNDKYVSILPHTNTPEELMFNSLIKDLMVKRYPRLCVELPALETVYDYENQIRSSYIAIGMRYHTVVLASKNGVPFLSLSYENKMDEVSEYSNQSEYNLRLNEIENSDSIYSLLSSIQSHHDQISRDLLVNSIKMRKQAMIVLDEQLG